MAQLAEPVAYVLTRGRQKKFTPESSRQESGGARNEPRADRRVDRCDCWFAAGHLLQVGRQFAAT